MEACLEAGADRKGYPGLEGPLRRLGVTGTCSVERLHAKHDLRPSDPQPRSRAPRSASSRRTMRPRTWATSSSVRVRSGRLPRNLSLTNLEGADLTDATARGAVFIMAN